MKHARQKRAGLLALVCAVALCLALAKLSKWEIVQLLPLFDSFPFHKFFTTYLSRNPKYAATFLCVFPDASTASLSGNNSCPCV